MRKKARQLIIALTKINEVYLADKKSRKITEAELCLMYALDDDIPHSQMDISRDWLIPKTTINTIIKKWEKENWVTQRSIPGKRREMVICLTETGRAFVNGHLGFFYQAEEEALKRTLEQYEDTFIVAIEVFGTYLAEAFEKRLDK